MKWMLQTLTAIVIVRTIECYPVQQPPQRQPKNLAYLDFLQPTDYNPLDIDTDNYMELALEDNHLSRTIPPRKQDQFNSPVYYIRIPPQPYMFVPGLGYVSPPVAPPVSQFLNVPVSFVSNGKPSAIYQWSGAFQGFGTPTQAPPSSNYMQHNPQRPLKKPLKDSNIHKLPGSFGFNGKPDDIYVLRDSYNSLYSDVLQNVYP